MEPPVLPVLQELHDGERPVNMVTYLNLPSDLAQTEYLLCRLTAGMPGSVRS